MAIEVIKLGRVKTEGYSGTCASCGTEVFFLASDALAIGGSQRDGEHATVSCPLMKDGCTDIIYGYPHVKY